VNTDETLAIQGMPATFRNAAALRFGLANRPFRRQQAAISRSPAVRGLRVTADSWTRQDCVRLTREWRARTWSIMFAIRGIPESNCF